MGKELITEKNVTSRIETITPDVARDYLKSNIFNRSVSHEHVSNLAYQMKNGFFEFNGETIIFSDENVLLDGQHRLLACVRANIPFMAVVVRGVSRESFHTIDIGKNRSVADMFTTSRVENANKISSMIQNYVRLRNGRLSVFGERSNMRGLKVSRKELLDIYYKESSAIQEAHNFASKCYKKLRLLKHSEIGGIILYLTLEKKHPNKLVEDFFYDLFFNGGNCKCNAINILRTKLINDLASDRRMTSKFKYVMIAKAWNAYLLKKELKVLSWNEEREGIVYMK